MRSVIFKSFGVPAEVLQLGEMPRPEPAAGQVRIAMKMSPIHNHDLSIIRGVYGYKPTLPAVPGTEAVGVIDALGDGVTRWKIGQRVTLASSRGAWAESFVADQRVPMAIPDSISDEAACQLTAMPLSALMLLEDQQLTAGQWMIQNTANGAVGKTLARIAALRGINVVNLVRRDAGVAELEQQGIGNAVSTERSGWEDRVKAITGGAPILRAIDSIGGDVNGIMSTLADGGTLWSFGAMSGKPLKISPDNLLFKQTIVRGYWISKRLETTGVTDIARMMGELIGMVESGTIKLTVDRAFDLSEVVDAVKASDQPGRSGKIVLTNHP